MAKLVVNTIPLLAPLTGIGRYTYEVSKRIKGFNKYFYYGYYSKKLLLPEENSKAQIKSFIDKVPLLKKIARKAANFSAKFTPESFDIYWEPNFIPIEEIKAKKVVTSVHDFSFILYKEFHPKERIEYFEKNFFKNIKRSDFIICFSNFTKGEILERLDFKENQVEVIYHGVDHNLFRVYKDIKLDFELPKKFILSVGSIEPRKNLIGLLKAYNNLPKELKEEYHLVLAGFKGWNNDEIMQIIEKNKNTIHYLGYISDVELAKVYNLASLFVYPSFYEGFGIPPLEAMACGTPVITSNVSSLPEVGGDAVIYCNPNEVEDIQEKMQKVLENENLQKELSQKGLNRAKQFTWENSTKKHIEIFKNLQS